MKYTFFLKLQLGEGFFFRFGDANFKYLRQIAEGKILLMLHPVITLDRS